MAEVASGAGCVQQGLEFEDDVYDCVRHKYPYADIERQVHGVDDKVDIVIRHREKFFFIERQVHGADVKVDIVIRHRYPREEKTFIECKCLLASKLGKSAVDQVMNYREILGDPERDDAWVVTADETERTGNVDEYAQENDVKIYTLGELVE